MNKCPKCGTEFAGSFCPECGTMWLKERRCPRCGKSMPGSAKFCTYCGNAFFERPAQRRNESLEKFLQYFPAGLLLLFSLLLWAFYAAPVFKVDILIGSIEGNLYQIYGEEMLQELHATILALFVITAVTCVCAILLLIFARKLSKPAYLLLTSVFYLFYIVLGSLLIVKIKGAELGAGACPILILVFACVFAVASAVAVLLRKQAKRKKKSSAAAWIKRHKCLFGLSIAGAVAVVIVSIVVPVALANRYNGTYYLYEDEEYKYETYFILKGSTYTDETGYSCDAEFDGNHVTFYSELFGVKEKAAEGTIEKDVLKLNIMGAEVVYAKEGHKHEFGQQEVVTEPTCNQSGVTAEECYCGFQRKDTTKPEALGHDFQNHICTRCGINSNILLEYSLNADESGYTVTGIGSCSDREIIFPNEYNGKPVIAIGAEAFSGYKELTSITISDSVIEIGYNAFYDCDGLTGELKIPDSVTRIGGNAFEGCSGLTSVKIGSGVTWISWNTFQGCSGLTEITIPDSVTEIGYEAFSGCSGLIEITIPDSVTWIGERAFVGCSGLTSVKIGSGVTSIGVGAFSGCSGLTKITIPDSVTVIGEYAFYNCSGLTGELKIPDSVTSIGVGAFSGCSGLTEIKVDEQNQTYHAKGNCLIETKGKTLILGCKTSQIPDDGSVTVIGYGAFYKCSGLTGELKIPDSVTSIGSSAFWGCGGLTEITIPDSVTEIGLSAFVGTAYYNDENHWTEDVLYIGNHLIEAKDTISGSYSIRNGTKTIAGSAFYNSGLTEITIPNSVISIGVRAFAGCSGLTEIIIPDSVVEIGREAFAGCSGLTEIIIPDSVVEIGREAFSGCSGLTSVKIGNSVTEIGYEVFYNCSGLTEITIPDSVTSIGGRAFAGCSGLKNVHFENPNGWRASSSNINSSSLEDPATAAKYLTNNYCEYYWERED